MLRDVARGVCQSKCPLICRRRYNPQSSADARGRGAGTASGECPPALGKMKSLLDLLGLLPCDVQRCLSQENPSTDEDFSLSPATKPADAWRCILRGGMPPGAGRRGEWARGGSVLRISGVLRRDGSGELQKGRTQREAGKSFRSKGGVVLEFGKRFRQAERRLLREERHSLKNGAVLHPPGVSPATKFFPEALRHFPPTSRFFLPAIRHFPPAARHDPSAFRFLPVAPLPGFSTAWSQWTGMDGGQYGARPGARAIRPKPPVSPISTPNINKTNPKH